MATIDVVDKSNKKVKKVELNDTVFATKINNQLLYQTVIWQNAKRRSGNACAKTRAEVVHSTKKPFRQKGTGRARQGMTSSPLLVGGGVVFPPKPRDYSYKLNKKMLQGALRSALSYKFSNNKIKVVDSLDLAEIKTKEIKKILDSMSIKNVLIVDSTNEKLYRSTRNLKAAKYLNVSGLNVYDLLKYEYLLITEKSLASLGKLNTGE